MKVTETSKEKETIQKIPLSKRKYPKRKREESKVYPIAHAFLKV
jgi:hypothetical protein